MHLPMIHIPSSVCSNTLLVFQVVFLLLNFENSSHDMDTRPLLIMWYVNIFSQSSFPFQTLNNMFQREEFLIDKIYFKSLFFKNHYFYVIYKNSLATPKSMIFLFFFLEV